MTAKTQDHPTTKAAENLERFGQLWDMVETMGFDIVVSTLADVCCTKGSEEDSHTMKRFWERRQFQLADILHNLPPRSPAYKHIVWRDGNIVSIPKH